MEYDRGGSFPINFEQNGHQFGSKSEGKQSPRSYFIKIERICKSFFSECTIVALNTSLTD